MNYSNSQIEDLDGGDASRYFDTERKGPINDDNSTVVTAMIKKENNCGESLWCFDSEQNVRSNYYSNNDVIVEDDTFVIGSVKEEIDDDEAGLSCHFDTELNNFSSASNKSDINVEDNPFIIIDHIKDEKDGGDEVWYFDSEHEELKNNEDYQKLIKCLAVLEAQRIQLFKDYDSLALMKARALGNPFEFVKKLRSGDVKFPTPFQVAEVPVIDMSKYKEEKKKFERPPRRRAAIAQASKLAKPVTKTSSSVLVRGRPFDDSKPETFNQLWSAGEQERLDELLKEFPPELVEQNRYKKIAAALGNRTHQQVASRVQKYFLKLHKVGLTIPGRTPRTNALETRTKQYHQRRPPRPSTFFPAPPPLIQDYGYTVLTPEAETVRRTNPNVPYDEDSSEDELVKLMGSETEDADALNMPRIRELAEQSRYLRVLTKVKEEKSFKIENIPKHYGYECTYCGESPLEGTRWHCKTCTDRSVDLCTDCVISQLESSDPHPLAHRLTRIRSTYYSKMDYDQDYASAAFSSGNYKSYNYLDPNFMPS